MKKVPVSESDRSEILALRLAIRGRLSVVLKEVQKAVDESHTDYDDRKIEETLQFNPNLYPGSYQPRVTVTPNQVPAQSLVEFKRNAAALGHKAAAVLQAEDVNVPSLSEVLTQIEATVSEFTSFTTILTDPYATKQYNVAIERVNVLGRKMLRDPLDYPVRMQLIQAIFGWLQALNSLA